MKTLKKNYRKVICTLLVAVTTSAQDFHFSQFNETPLLLNPAAAASGYDMRAILNYREQWRSVSVPFKTFAGSFETKLSQNKNKKGQMGIGAYALTDRAGTSKMGTSQFVLALSGMIHANRENIFAAGISGGYNQRSVTASGLRWDNQYNGQSYDPTLSSAETFSDQSFGYADVNAGIQWNYGHGERYITSNDQIKAHAGISYHHINRPTQKFLGGTSKLYSRITTHGGCVFGIGNTNVLIAPGFVCHIQGKQTDFTLGSLIKFKLSEDSKYTGFKKGACFSIGGFYRIKDAFILNSQIEFGNYSLGLSYDVNTSGLKSASYGKGGLEISLRFVSPNPHLSKSVSMF